MNQSRHLKLDLICNKPNQTYSCYTIYTLYWISSEYCEVASNRHKSICRLFMEGKFDAYVLRPLEQRVQKSKKVEHSIAVYFMVTQKSWPFTDFDHPIVGMTTPVKWDWFRIKICIRIRQYNRKELCLPKVYPSQAWPSAQICRIYKRNHF